MKRKIIGIIIMTLLIATSLPITTTADWNPEDGHKMHFPQLPDPNGWDVHATAPLEISDDWLCTETGYIQDIHFWGSWHDDIKGTINSFKITIYSDIPSEQSQTGYSMPGDILWSRVITDWIERGPYTGEQGWYWPENMIYEWKNHQLYYQYNIFLDEPWFIQEEDHIYWLGISANVLAGTGTWGWKSSDNRWNDDAVWKAPGAQWDELYEPEPPLINQFWLTMAGGEPIEGGGTDYYDDGTSLFGWYYYPYYWPDIWWWNIWFYDHPFDFEKYKEIYVSFYCDPIAPVWFVINVATDYWFLEGEKGRPPLPRDLPDPQYEDICIDRLPSPYEPIQVEPGFNEFWFTIPDYNPEWISIDFMGTDFVIYDGMIVHQCLPPEPKNSLDLAFVITGEPICDPCINLDKHVWHPVEESWVEEIEACICENVSFNITICNCGTCNLTDIIVTDTLPDCLEYVDGSSTWFEPKQSGNILTWDFSNHPIIEPLEPNWCFAIIFDAHVISEDENINCAEVYADSSKGIVFDSNCATVIGLECIGKPNLDCSGRISWTEVKPGTTVTDSFTVSNIGDLNSELDWKVESYPTWGTWTILPNNGDNLKPSDGPFTVQVSVVAPSDKEQTFSGLIKIINKNNISDNCTITVSLATPKTRQPYLYFVFQEFIKKNPYIFPILRKLLGF
jgi:uncharacterized repeat protein (TIGR01451 family)